eukprot:scaffold347267_cov33-Prasinocladus_malaysianus.AAC.2
MLVLLPAHCRGVASCARSAAAAAPSPLLLETALLLVALEQPAWSSRAPLSESHILRNLFRAKLSRSRRGIPCIRLAGRFVSLLPDASRTVSAWRAATLAGRSVSRLQDKSSMRRADTRPSSPGSSCSWLPPKLSCSSDTRHETLADKADNRFCPRHST